MKRSSDDSRSPSSRGLANLGPNPMFDLEREKEKYPVFDPVKCPDGLIDISSAKNTLMTSDLQDWCEKNRNALFNDITRTLEYGATAGTDKLREAIAQYTNRYFKPTQTISADSIIVGNGVSSLLGTLAYNICDANEAVMLEVPNYGMFGSDLTYQTGIQLVKVHTDELNDRFLGQYASQLIDAYERSLKDAAKNGITIKAVLICNPCNPIGRCYSKSTLQSIAQFCARHNLHLISDEIYALSSGDGTETIDGFTSVLSLPKDGGVSFKNIHVLSGASKDFGLGGLRLGWIIIRNDILWQTVRRLATTTWVTSFSDTFFSNMLSDSKFVDRYAHTLHERLGNLRSFAMQCLDEMQIPYENANAGVFLWIDLGRWIASVNNCRSSIASAHHEDHEMRLTRYLMSRGVYLQPGGAFFATTVGRYRLVYTANSHKVFALALSRLKDALDDLDSQYSSDFLESASLQSGSTAYSDAPDVSSLNLKETQRAVKPTETKKGETNARVNAKHRILQAVRLLCCSD